MSLWKITGHSDQYKDLEKWVKVQLKALKIQNPDGEINITFEWGPKKE